MNINSSPAGGTPPTPPVLTARPARSETPTPPAPRRWSDDPALGQYVKGLEDTFAVTAHVVDPHDLVADGLQDINAAIAEQLPGPLRPTIAVSIDLRA